MTADSRTRSLLLLSEGFKQEFANYVYVNEQFTDLIQELVIDFIADNIPVVNEDDQCELGMMLIETIRLGSY